MKLGIDDHTFYSSGIPANAFDYIDRISKLGLEGIHFSTPAPFESLSEDYLLKVKARLDELGFYVELGMGACNLFSPCRTPGDPREQLKELIHSAAIIGAPMVRTFFGFLEVERMMKSPNLEEQIQATVAILKDVKHTAEEYKVKIGLENHLDLTAKELLGLIEAVDSEYVGVCFDFGNQLFLLEDPAEAAEILAPHIYSTHFKDGIIFPTEDGAVWVRTLFGDGFVDLPSIINTIYKHHPEVNLSIEDLPDLFRIPLFDNDFMNSLHLTGAQIGKVIKWLREGEKMVQAGKLPFLDDLKGPDKNKVIENRIPINVELAKKLLKELGI